MRRAMRDTYLGSVARPLLEQAYNWPDSATPRTDHPARFDYQWGGPLYPRASWIVRPDDGGMTFEFLH